MTTRKIIIENEYLRLCKQITTILDKKIMPDLNTYELSDILFMLIHHFSDCNDINYKFKIDFIIDLDTAQIVTQDEREKIYDVIYVFVKWFKKLQ